MKIYKLNSFIYKNKGGNEAGVVLNADNLTEKEMLNIAKEVGYSETAFVMKSNVADFKVRFFTPSDEVDLCGHATIATFSLLRELKIIQIGSYTQETKAGILKLEVNQNSVFMEQNLAEFSEIISKEEIKKCFNSINNNYIGKMPIQIVSTGLRDIIVEIKNLEILNVLEPDFEAITKLSKKYNAVGMHLFCTDKESNKIFYARNFAPRYNIPEESATGTSNGALGCYLSKYKENLPNDLKIYQGISMNKKSEILVKLIKDKKNIKQLFVGGNAIEIEKDF